MKSNENLKARPLTKEELHSRSGEFNRPGTNSIKFQFSVSGSNLPAPKTSVHREDDNSDNWRISFEISDFKLLRRNGLTVNSMKRMTKSNNIKRQLNGFVPDNAIVKIHPSYEKVYKKVIKLRGSGGNFTPLEVFPGDARHLLTDNSWPWRLSGLVTTSDGAAGTGVLVGDRLMLTAHHLRPSNSIAQGSWWMNFTPNFDSGNNPVAPFGSSNVSDLQHYDSESDTEYIVGHDYMLCRLYEPLGQQLGYLGSTTFNDDWRGMQVWHNIGYPGDVGGGTRPAVQVNQSMEDDYEDDDGQYMETEASLNHGNSGGPFFSWFDDGQVRICGVVSGGLTFNGDRDNAIAGGYDMVNLIDWGRSNWPV